jgi:hypothetical protein
LQFPASRVVGENFFGCRFLCQPGSLSALARGRFGGNCRPDCRIGGGFGIAFAGFLCDQNGGEMLVSIGPGAGSFSGFALLNYPLLSRKFRLCSGIASLCRRLLCLDFSLKGLPREVRPFLFKLDTGHRSFAGFKFGIAPRFRLCFSLLLGSKPAAPGGYGFDLAPGPVQGCECGTAL